MKCPACGGYQVRTVDSRPCADDLMTRRRKECPECGHRFTTYEVQMVAVTKRELKVILSDDMIDLLKLPSVIENEAEVKFLTEQRKEN